MIEIKQNKKREKNSKDTYKKKLRLINKEQRKNKKNIKKTVLKKQNIIVFW